MYICMHMYMGVDICMCMCMHMCAATAIRCPPCRFAGQDENAEDNTKDNANNAGGRKSKGGKSGKGVNFENNATLSPPTLRQVRRE